MQVNAGEREAQLTNVHTLMAVLIAIVNKRVCIFHDICSSWGFTFNILYRFNVLAVHNSSRPLTESAGRVDQKIMTNEKGYG